VILPQTPFWDLQSFIKEFKAKKVTEGFHYNSGENQYFLSVAQLQELISKHIK